MQNPFVPLVRIYTLLHIGILISLSAVGQASIKGAELTYATKIGHIESLRAMQERQLTDAEKLKSFKANKPEVVQNFIGRRHLESIAPGAKPVGEDPARQSVTLRSVERIIEPFALFEGLSEDDSHSGVPDVNGDVSDQFYVEIVNATLIQVFDFAGNAIGDPITANTIWSSIGFSSAGDPVILYDRTAGRWFITEFPPSNRVLIAISDTEDPFGGWSAYAFSTPRFPDYPKYGIWPEAYVLTTNESGGGSVKFYFINREDLLSGADQARIQRFTIPRFNEPSFQVATPVDWIGTEEPDSNLGPMIVRINDDGWGDSSEDLLEIWEADINWDDQDSSVVNQHSLPTLPFDSDFCSVPGPGFSCVPQPNGVGIDGIPWVVMHKVQLRNFGPHCSMVLNFPVDATGDDVSGIRWMELRKSPGAGWGIYQESTYAPDDGLQRFMGGISIDNEGNIGLAFNVSNSAKHPSLRFTGRRYNDPPGIMTVKEYEFATGSGSNGSDRFGDYASMSVDANDNFWYAGEYILGNGEWSTKIVGFALRPDTHDLALVALTAPENAVEMSATETVSILIENQGTASQDSFYVGFQFENQPPVTDLVLLDSLPHDSAHIHTFTETVDVSITGDYAMKVFCSLWNDQNSSNDTLRLTISNLARRDAAMSGLEGINGVVCDSFAYATLILSNLGQDTLFSSQVIYGVNDGEADTINWEGSLAFGEISALDIFLDQLNGGDNYLYAIVSHPNGLDDEITTNDSLYFPFYVQDGGSLLQIFITTDDYPGETTWELTDPAGNIIYSGGPYENNQTLYVEDICLDTSRCYTFTIFDAFGDGISAGGVSGDYMITNSEGFVLATLNDPFFGSQESNNFCGNLNCMLNIRSIVGHETRPGQTNGIINIITSNAQSPIQFSINGGMNFQASPIFSGLSPGIYPVYVKDGSGCIAIDSVEILSCDMELMAEITGVTHTDSMDGTMVISVTGNNGPLQYSLTGSGGFQANPVFNMLSDSTYTVTVKDSVGCLLSTEFTVDVISSSTVLSSRHFIKIFPNPSDGVFHLEVYGVDALADLPFDVLEGNGKIIYRGYTGSYNGILKGLVSLRQVPSGVYYLRFRDEQFVKLYRLVKQ